MSTDDHSSMIPLLSLFSSLEKETKFTLLFEKTSSQSNTLLMDVLNEKQTNTNGDCVVLELRAEKSDVSQRTLLPTYEQSQIVVNQIDQSTNSKPGEKLTSLGICALAFTTFIYSTMNIGPFVYNFDAQSMILPIPLFYGGLIQFVVGLYKYRPTNEFISILLINYGAFWMFLASYMHLILPKIPAIGESDQATALFLLAGFIFTLPVGYLALEKSQIVTQIIFILRISFVCVILGYMTHMTWLINLSGCLGILYAFLTWCISFSRLLDHYL